MESKIVYDFLKELLNGESAIGMMIQCVENKRNGIWDQIIYDGVKKGLRLWWFDKYGFHNYIDTLRGLSWAA